MSSSAAVTPGRWVSGTHASSRSASASATCGARGGGGGGTIIIASGAIAMRRHPGCGAAGGFVTTTRRTRTAAVPVGKEDVAGNGTTGQGAASNGRGSTTSGKAVADRALDAAEDTEEDEVGYRVVARTGAGMRVVDAKDDAAFEIAAQLRATAFYDDLLERQELPFPPRFTATFHREFAQRERKALRERTTRKVGSAMESRCYMAEADEFGLVGCLDVSVREGPCASQINGVCVGEGASYAYVDNVAVDAAARRRGAARLMLECASDFAVERGMREIWTHVHCDNVGARKLYHAYGFRAPHGTFPIEGLANHYNGTRLKGLMLLRAELPLVHGRIEDNECRCGACFEAVERCVCLPSAR